MGASCTWEGATVIRIDLPSLAVADIERLGQMLSNEEMTRLRSGGSSLRHTSFIAAHGGLRLLAANILGLPPSVIAVVQRCVSCGRPHGQPRLFAKGGGRLACGSISYSQGTLLVGVALAGDLGIDLELLRPATEFASIAHLILSESEVEAAANERTTEELLATWVRKEAALKMAGWGLTRDPHSVTVRAINDRESTVFDDLSTKPLARVLDLDLPSGLIGALAIRAS